MSDFDLIQQRLALARALNERPDDFARKTKIAQALQKPPGLLTPEDEQLYTLDNTMQQLENSPIVRKRIGTDGKFATLAQDDLERLANIEYLARLKRERARQEQEAYERENAPWAITEFGSSLWTGFRRWTNNIDMQQANAAQKTIDEMEAREGKVRSLRQRGALDLLSENIGADPFTLTSAASTYDPDELYRKKHESMTRARDENIAEYEEDLSALVPTRSAQTQREMDAYMAKEGAGESLAYIITHPRMATNMMAESFGQFAPTLVATGVATAVAGPGAGAAVIGVGSAQMEHASTLADRIDASAAQENKSRADILADRQLMNDIRNEATRRGIVIGGVEALTFRLTGPAFHAMKKRYPGWKGTAAGWAAGTGVQSAGGASGEALAQLAVHDEITSWPAVVAEAYLEILQGTTEIATHAKYGKKVLQEEQRQDAENLRELAKNVQESKLGQRDPEALRDYLDEVLERGGMQDVYLDGDVLNQGNLAEMLANTLPEQAQGIQDAIDNGGTVQIKTRDILTRVADNPGLAAALEPHIRHAADGYSQAELDSTVEEEIKADLARSVAEVAADEAKQAEVDAVRDEYAAQLDATGVLHPEVSKLYATVVASAYGAQAERLGITIQEAVALNPLKIVGEPVSGFNQEVWHGTPYRGIENEGFSLRAIGTGEGAQAYGWGIYFAGDREISEAYRRKLSPAERVVSFPEGDENVTFTETNEGWVSEEDGGVLEGAEAAAADILEHGDIEEVRQSLAEALEDGFDRIQVHRSSREYDVDDVQEALDLIDRDGIKIETRNGQLYSADIPENDVLLDYDAPLSEQPEAVKAALEKAFAEQGKEETFAEMKEENARGEDFYNALAAPQEASEALLRQGIPGLRYLDGNSRADGEGNHNFVIWDEDLLTPDAANIESYYQRAANNTGKRGAFDPATNTIALLQKADLSTFIHELGHFFFESNINIANSLRARDNAAGGGTLTDAEKQLLKDVDALLAQGGLDLDTWNIMTLDQRRHHHEYVARQFEAYMMEGKAPVPELQSLFARARAWLFQLYKKLTALNVQLTDDVRQVFDRMIVGEAAINQARQMRLGTEMLLDADIAGMTADEFTQFHQDFQAATNMALDEMQLRQLADAKAIARLKHKALRNKNKEAKAARGLMEMDARRAILSQPVYRAWQLLTGKMTPATTIASNKRAWTDSVEPAHDDLFTAIAKLGGINRQEIESTWGFDPKDKISPVKPGFFVLRKTGGETIDGMKRLLEQYGYLTDQDTLNDFYDLFMEQHRGNTQYSNQHIPDPGTGKAGEGANLQNLPAFRLDYRSLEDMGYSDDQIQALGKKVWKKPGGIHPDFLAALIFDDQGNVVYDSGDALVQALLAVPDPKTAITQLADQMMLQQYGELATPQAIAEAADLAMHNDLTLRVLATEYNALAKATGKPPLVSRNALQLAEQVIGRTRVRDINPTKYTRMEAKAAKRAFAAAKKGDTALAATEKRNQLLQAAHARRAYEAKAEIKKMINYLRRAAHLKPKSIDIAYREQIEALLDGYNLRDRSDKALARRQSLADWVQDQRNQGIEPNIPDSLLDDLNRKPWQELTVDELRGLADTVKQIEYIGKHKHKLLTARKNKNAKKVIAKMAQAVEDNAQQADRDNRTPITITGRARVWTRGFLADHRRVAMLTRQMEGNVDGGVITDTLIRPANVAGDIESELTAHAIDYFNQHLVPAYNRKSKQRRAYNLGGKTISLSDREIFAMLLNWGNEGNRLRLLDGEGWKAAEIEALFAARLTAEDARAVQKVWDYYANHTKDKIAAIARRVDGMEPKWVEPLPFTFTDASGESVDLQGGYYPIMKDPMRSPTVQAQQELDMRNGNTGRAAVRDGFTKSRAKRVYGQPLRYDLAGIYQGLGDVIHYIAWREWTVDASRLLGDNDFTRAVIRKHGPEALKQLRSWRDDIISNGNREREGGVQIFSTLRQNIALANLGFSSTTAVAQALGLFQSMVRVGHSNILWGTLRYLGSPLEMTNSARAASKLLQNRGRTQFRELNELRNMVGERSKIRSAASKYGFWLLLKVQGAVDIITWHAQYEKSVLAGATDEDAVAQADQAVIDSQGSGMLKDLSAAERGGELKKLFTVHYNYMNTVYNLQYNTLTARNNGAAKKIADILTLSVLMVIADHALRSLFTPGDDDKWDEDKIVGTISRDVLAFQFGQFVGLRELQGVINGYGYSGPTGTSAFANVAKLWQQAGQGEMDDAFLRALIQTGGSVAGLPSAQINRTFKGARALADDDTDNPLALAFGYQQ